MTHRPERAARAPAPALPAFDELDRTHARILEELDHLAQLVARVEQQGLDAQARRSAQGICRFFEGEAQQHHADEERLVFPPLLNRGDDKLAHEVRRLQQDHGWLEEDWRQLSPHLKSIAEGYAGYDIDMLGKAVPIFDALYREHIAMEESMVYPAARRTSEGKPTGTPDRTKA